MTLEPGDVFEFTTPGSGNHEQGAATTKEERRFKGLRKK